MAYPHGFLDEIRARIPTSEIVGKRVQLKKRGREWVGLSPFKNENTPSFTVNDDKGFYHCFATGEHGDIFTFMMRVEGLSFPESVEQLAERAGLEVPKQTPQEQAKERTRLTLYDVTEETCRYYQRMLRNPAGKRALDYLKERGLTDQTIAHFRLGYAPQNGDELKTKLKAANCTDEAMLEAGIFRTSNDGRAPYAFFRDRIIFPIADRRARIIAYGGRFMGDAKAAGVGKYINSPDTPLFDKGRTLYNIAGARRSAHDGAQVIVAEGYMDVIALAQAGFEAGVAPLGTALTPEQITEIWRIQATPNLCFDGDEAGQRAAKRAAERALPILDSGKSLKFVFMPDGEDPDSLIASQGRAKMQSLIDEAMPLDQFIWETELALNSASTPEQKALLEKELMHQASQIPDKTIAKHYRQAFGERLWQQFRKKSFKGSKPKKTGYKNARAESSAPKAEGPRGKALLATKHSISARQQQIVLACLVNHPNLLYSYEEVLERFEFQAELDKLRLELQKITSLGVDLDLDAVRTHFIDSGKDELLGRVLDKQIYLLAAQAHFDASDEEAGELLDHLLLIQTQDEIVSELRNRRDGGNGQLDNAKEAQVLAIRSSFDDGERRLGVIDEEVD